MKTKKQKKLNLETSAHIAHYYSSFSTIEDAWNACNIGEYMLWLAANIGVESRLLTKAKTLCANTVIHLLKECKIREGVVRTKITDALDAAVRYNVGEIWRSDNDNDIDNAASYAAQAVYCNARVAHYNHSGSKGLAYKLRAKNQQKTANICRAILTGAVMKKLKNYSAVEITAAPWVIPWALE